MKKQAATGQAGALALFVLLALINSAGAHTDPPMDIKAWKSIGKVLGPEPAKISLFDACGRMVARELKQSDNSCIIKAAKQHGLVYFVTIQSAKKSFVTRLIQY